MVRIYSSSIRDGENRHNFQSILFKLTLLRKKGLLNTPLFTVEELEKVVLFIMVKKCRDSHWSGFSSSWKNTRRVLISAAKEDPGCCHLIILEIAVTLHQHLQIQRLMFSKGSTLAAIGSRSLSQSRSLVLWALTHFKVRFGSRTVGIFNQAFAVEHIVKSANHASPSSYPVKNF